MSLLNAVQAYADEAGIGATLVNAEDPNTALHEAAHCVASYALGMGGGSIWLDAEGDFAGTFAPAIGGELSGVDELVREGVTTAAGPAIDRFSYKKAGLKVPKRMIGEKDDERQIRNISSFVLDNLDGQRRCCKEVRLVARRLVKQPVFFRAACKLAMALLKKRYLSEIETTKIMCDSGIVPGMYDEILYDGSFIAWRARADITSPAPAMREAA